MTPQQMSKYFAVTQDALENPEKLDRIADGAKLLIKHIKNNDKTLIQVDSDCDGYTSAALLINYLNRIFPGYVQNYVSYRVHTGKQHGIIYETIPEDVKLVIAPDSSSNDYEEHKKLHERGCDVLVIDHHLADHVSEYACVINNQMCDYPTKSLSGVGVVYKFCEFIDSLLNKHIAHDYIDLAAIGIVGDMMDLRDLETHYIVAEGLINIRNPFFLEMMKKMDFRIQGNLNPYKTSFYIVPFINAVNRSGTLEERILLFESMLEFKSYNLVPSTKRGAKGEMETRVEQAVRTSTNVKNRQGRTVDSTKEEINLMLQDPNISNHVLIALCFPANRAIDKNITGLIATQIANNLRHPTAILNQVSHGDEIWWEGSMRGAPNIPINDTRQMFLDSGLVEYCEGHANAGGVGIKEENLDKLISYLDIKYKDIDFSPVYFVDAEIDTTKAGVEDDIAAIGWLDDYWGQGLEEPNIAFTKVKVTADNIKLMKESTIKIDCGEYNFIKFHTNEEEYDFLYSEYGYKELTIIGTCKINEFNGMITPQVVIKDYEVMKSNQYYF